MRHKQEYSYKLTEEIARWAFEVRINNESRDWDIVFTNPTAGPWKRIMASNEDGIKGEVYRFDREEDRPDLILVNDDLKIVTIIEAKDSLEKLVTDGQIIKSANVVNNLSNKLHNLRNHKYWGNRNTYVYIAGLLWGAESKSTVKMRESAFGKYIELIDTCFKSIKSSFLPF